MFRKMMFLVAGLLLTGISKADCIEGDSLFLISPQVHNPVIYDAVARDRVTYHPDMKEIHLSGKPDLSPGHVLFLYSGFWLATEDWCYDTETNVIRLHGHLRHGVSKAEIQDNSEVWVGYEALEDSHGDCVMGNVVSAQPGKPWSSNGPWERDGRKYEQINEGYYIYDTKIEGFALKGSPAPGTQVEVSATVAGIPVGTYKLDWCYNARTNSIHFLHAPLHKAGYGALPGNELKNGEYFFVTFSEDHGKVAEDGDVPGALRDYGEIYKFLSGEAKQVSSASDVKYRIQRKQGPITCVIAVGPIPAPGEPSVNDPTDKAEGPYYCFNGKELPANFMRSGIERRGGFDLSKTLTGTAAQFALRILGGGVFDVSRDAGKVVQGTVTCEATSNQATHRVSHHCEFVRGSK